MKTESNYAHEKEMLHESCNMSRKRSIEVHNKAKILSGHQITGVNIDDIIQQPPTDETMKKYAKRFENFVRQGNPKLVKRSEVIEYAEKIMEDMNATEKAMFLVMYSDCAHKLFDMITGAYHEEQE